MEKPEVYFVDPRRLDVHKPKRWEYDPDTDWQVLIGADDFTPAVAAAYADGCSPCAGCGGGRAEPLERWCWINDEATGRRKRVRSLAVCAICTKATLDGVRKYFGEPVGSRLNPGWDQPDATTYIPDDGLVGGKGTVKLTRKVKRASMRKEKASA